MIESALKFIQDHSPDGGFLQSQYWRKFQESVGRKTFFISEKDEEGKLIASASIIKHTLPIVGDYFYIPRGPVLVNYELGIMNYEEKAKIFIHKIIKLAKQHKVNWIRIEPASEDILEFLRFNLKNQKIKKSSVDIQPREILVMDITKSEEELLAGMKQKTRYNVRLAEKKGVRVFSANNDQGSMINRFLELVKITAERDGITPHPENYYRKMFEIIPPEILKLYVAEYQGKIIAASLVLFFGKTATYMHGASDNTHRDAMAPYLLQWQAIQDAKKAGCERYDLGGVRTQPHPSPLLIKERGNPWAGITRFKTSFSPETKSIQFPGCYDIVLNPFKYSLYRILQRIKRVF